MNIFAVSGFINGISAFIFGLIVYLANPKQLANKTFGLMTFALGIWSFSYGFWQLSSNRESALIWVQILSIGSTFIPIFFLHWIFATFNIVEKRKTILIFGYILTLIFLSFSLTPLYIKDVSAKLIFPWWPTPGIVYNFYLILGYLGAVAYGSYELIRIYKKTVGHTREQIKYILLAMAVGFGGGATNFPLWYGIPLMPYGNFLLFFYPFILAYAILKHKLMDIKIVLTEVLVILIAFVILTETFFSKTIFEISYRTALFLIFCFLGYLLIRSVLNEIKRRVELERLTAELKKAYSKLEELDKAKSEFISIASHQLRTPLTAIKGYISMMLERVYGKMPGKAEKPLENIYTSNERLIKLVNDLLNVSRIEAGRIKLELKKISLEEVINSVVEELKNEAKKKNIYLKFEKPKKLLSKILADRNKIRQVIMNVVDNAIRYTEHGGVTVQIQNPKSKIQIIVSDTGEGLTKYELSKMFESFSRGMAGTRLYTEGVGLGLYIAKKFVEMHEGKIWAESKGKSKGSTFFIELPTL
jgi:signal transduction histidine kinase